MARADGDAEREWLEQLEQLEQQLRALVRGAAERGLGARFAERAAELLTPAELARVEAELADEAAARKASPPSGRFGLIGQSPKMLALYALLERVCTAHVPVLIQGETGTGKELVARALHEHGPRRKKPFLAENCAAVPAQLLESELFGHKRGSFTGAVADRAGHFAAADGGTVFLDEIGDMPLAMQAKLLRVLQEGEVRPVGSNATVRVDVRVVGATNKDLRAMCAAKEFREDLYFRLSVVTLQLPPLRERPGDVALLARFFLERECREAGRAPLELAPDALAALERARWPGNVRELENELRRAVALARGGASTLRLEDLSPALAAG